MGLDLAVKSEGGNGVYLQTLAYSTMGGTEGSNRSQSFWSFPCKYLRVTTWKGLFALQGPFQLGIFCDCHFTVTGLFLVLHWHCGLLLVKVWSSEPLNCWRQLRALCSVAEAKHMQALLQMCAVGSGCTCGL